MSEVKPGRTPAAESPGQTEWRKRAVALSTADDCQGMLDWGRKWTENEPKNADAWASLGLTYNSLQRYNDAIEAFRQAIGVDQKCALAWYGLGIAYDGLWHDNDAIEICHNEWLQACHIAWLKGTVALGTAEDWQIDLGREWEDWHMIDWGRNYAEHEPKNGEGWINLGIIYLLVQRYKEAIKAFSMAWVDPGHDPSTWNNLGIAYFLSGNRTAALDAVRELQHLDPAQADKLFNLDDAALMQAEVGGKSM